MLAQYSRRDFLKIAAAAGFTAATGIGLGSLFSDASENKKILVHIVLEGGPDWRHLIVPPYSGKRKSYGSAYWSNRRSIHIGPYSNTKNMKHRYRNDYVQLKGGNLGQFGILKKAGWLIDQYQKGNVAIINNVQHSVNRNHSWSLLISQSGDMNTRESEVNRDGWGGRLAAAMNVNILSMTNQVRLFCNPPKGVSRNMIVSAADSRNFGLYEPSIFYGKNKGKGPNPQRYHTPRAVLHRALKSYYRQKRKEEKNPVYTRFFEHEREMRKLGRRVRKRLRKYPDYYKGFPKGMSKNAQENLKKFNYGRTYLDTGFGLQLRNLFDSIITRDILKFNVASLDINGWDSHKLQQNYIEPKINQIFGNELLNRQGRIESGKYGGLKTLMELLPDSKAEDIVFVFSGDFGRQLKANGGKGTDHGRGNSIIVIGNQVNGGVYGSLFPKSEIKRYYQDNQDIEGLTSLARVYGAICDWQGDYADVVFPERGSSIIEKPGLLDDLFKT